MTVTHPTLLKLARATLAALAAILALAFAAPARAQRVNLAKFQAVSASVSNGTYVADFAVDGIVSNYHSLRTGDRVGPYWVEISYPRPVTLASAHAYLGILANATPSQVLVNFRYQYHDGSAWVDIPGSTVSANTATEVAVTFAQPVTATRFRLYSTDSGSRTIRELALFPPNLVGGVEQGFPLGTDVNLNLARQRPASASSASLTNIYGAGYAKNAFDGYLDNASRWVASAAAIGEYLEVDLLDTHRVATAHVYSGFIDPADATRTVTQPIPDFTLQYFDSATSAWLPVPGAEITGNTQVARLVEFTAPVTTSRIRMATTSAFNGRVQELLLFPPRTGGTPLGREVVNAPRPTDAWDRYSDSTYRLRNAGPDLRLGLVGGQPVLIAASTAFPAQTEWQLLLNHRDGTYRVRHIETGLCLALAQISAADNTPVTVEQYTGLPHQDWRLAYVDATRFNLVNAYSGLTLQTVGGSWTAGTSFVVRPAVSGLAIQIWSPNYLRHHPKKGIAATTGVISASQNPYTADPTLTFHQDFYNRLNGSWSYGWGRQTSDAFPYLSVSHAYNPMQWGNFNFAHGTSAGPLETIYHDVQSNPKPVHLMGFNEPEKTSQGYITVADALVRWPRLEAQNVPLVSPVPASTFGGWQADFTAQADALGYRRDYTAVHWYSSPSSDGLIAHLQQAYNDFGRPVWLTEFSTVDWSQTSGWTHADNFNFLAEFLWRAESLTWLKRYSLFAFIQGPTDNPNQSAPDPASAPRSNAFNSDGTLTPFGQLYAGWDGVAAIAQDRAYHLHNHGNYQRAQNPGGSSAPAAVAPTSSALGQQWFLSPGVTANTYRILSTRDGRPLRTADGVAVTLGAVGETGTAVEWRFTAETNGYGRHYILHPATAKRLRSNTNGTLSLAADTSASDPFKWRLVRPAVSDLAGPPAAPAGLAATPTAAPAVALSWSAVDGATGYLVERSATGTGSWTPVATGLANTGWTDTSVANSTQYFYRVTATNLYALSSAPSANASAVTPDVFASWTSQKLGARPAADQLPAADPDRDGLPNLLEYALGTEPLDPAGGPAALPPPAVASGRLRLSFRRIADPALTYEVLASSDIAAWTPIWSSTGAQNLAGAVAVDDTVDLASNPRRYLRLRVTR